jgi:hypothetical protein
MTPTLQSTATPDQALQRTAPAVTGHRPSPTMQPARLPPQSLSLGSLGHPDISTVFAKIIGLLLIFAAPVIAAELPIEGSLRKLNEYSPELTTELFKLAKLSAHAKAFLERPPEVGRLKFYGEIGYYALEFSGWSFKRCLLEFPVLCAQGRLVACLRAEDKRHYVIYTTDGSGPFAATVITNEGLVWFSLGQTARMEEDAQYYDFDVISDLRGDILVARFEPRTTLGSTTRRVYINHLYIRNRQIEGLKHVVEEYSISNK